jgi:GT2 family glycosyltransferase
MVIDILVVAYHAKEDLAELLSSVATCTSPGYRLTVYDNAVHNYPLSWIWNRFFEASGRDLVCVLNPDVILAADWDVEAKACMEADSSCGACAPLSNCQPHKEAFANPVPDVFPAGGLGPTVASLRDKFRAQRFARVVDYKMVPGHCAVIRKEAWRRIGGFNESVPFAGNDYDFNRRLVDAGMSLGVCLHAAVFHKWNRSIKAGIALGTFDQRSWCPKFSAPPAGRGFQNL